MMLCITRESIQFLTALLEVYFVQMIVDKKTKVFRPTAVYKGTNNKKKHETTEIGFIRLVLVSEMSDVNILTSENDGKSSIL